MTRCGESEGMVRRRGAKKEGDGGGARRWGGWMEKVRWVVELRWVVEEQGDGNKRMAMEEGCGVWGVGCGVWGEWSRLR